ncbi:MAG: vancomycin resistance protein [Clostridiales bacterium]|jgi:vancomycin resistance protein VanW|nr:vancomycin resistance protein [Clostridiales bacterium]
MFRRWLFWLFGGNKYGKIIMAANNNHTYFTHHTPLLRKLKDVDMYLQHNKVINLKLATKKINHTVLMPGQTFSYWKAIGNPTKRKGYKKGMILQGGTFKPGVGGGLCQLSNLIYWMTIHTPLTVVERYRHSYDVFPDSNRTQPFGSGATCVYNYRDLVIRNDTGQPFELVVQVTDSELEGCWKSNVIPLYTYEVYEKDHQMDHEFWGGYTRNNTLFRKIYDLEGVEVADEYVAENHALMMYPPFLTDSKL